MDEKPRLKNWYRNRQSEIGLAFTTDELQRDAVLVSYQRK